MAITTYAELQTAVTAWLVNDDLASQATTFIALAEAEINRRLANSRISPMEIRAAASVDSEYLAVPTNFVNVKRIAVTGLPREWKISYVDDENLERMKASESEYRAARSLETAQANVPPSYFSTIGDEFRFFPAPTATFALEIAYWAKIPALSVSNTSNWLLAEHPDAYLYGALASAAEFIEDPARLDRCGALFDRAIEGVKASYPSPRDNAPLVSDISLMRDRRSVFI